MIDCVRSAFLDEAAPGGNPLDPVTPMRLAFLVRGAVSTEWRGSEAEVFTALWDRRSEIADQASSALTTYRRASGDLSRRSLPWDVVEVARGILGSASAVVAFVAVIAAVSETRRVSDSLWSIRYILAGCLIGMVLSLITRGLPRRGYLRQYERYGQVYKRSIKGDLVKEIASMAAEVARLREDQASGLIPARVGAPSLVESGIEAVVQSESFREVHSLIAGQATSAIGVVGARGAGKSTLLRLLSSDEHLEPGRLSTIGRFVSQSSVAWPPAVNSGRIGVYLSAPADPGAGDFVKVIYATTVRKILASRNVQVGSGAGWRQRLGVRPADDVALALAALERITGTTSLNKNGTVGVSRYGISAGFGRQRTWTERELSHADWVAEFRDYLERHQLRGGAPILIAIDELDKITDDGRATEIINGIKDLFHIDGVHFILSVSDDALLSFATRGIPFRDTFDSAFDTVVEIPPMTAAESCDLLRARVQYFPYPAALLCHAWSGGLPRDLIRTARSCVSALNRAGTAIPISDLAQGIIRRDLLQFLDATIRRHDGADVESLLELRHGLVSDGVLHPPRGTTLGALLGVASAINEYFAIPRTPGEWAEGLESGSVLAAADLLGLARSALAVHPTEAEWQLGRASRALGLTGSGIVSRD